jgi:hypothetical protein
MYQQIDQSKLPIQGENSLCISEIKKGSKKSHVFRNILIEFGYSKFDSSGLKGEFCYDSYYKDLKLENELKYTLYCYCYDLKEIMEDPELFEFSLECQIESEKGVLQIESVQWNFINPISARENLKYFENRIESIWEILGSKKFPG